MEAKHSPIGHELPDLKNIQDTSHGRLLLRSVRDVGLWDQLPTAPFRFPATRSKVFW
jgi:hypothetical protein